MRTDAVQGKGNSDVNNIHKTSKKWFLINGPPALRRQRGIRFFLF
jgi:hypothetical protein